MKSIDYANIFKVSLGCSIAFVLAETFGFQYATSVVTITLLSILKTRKETFLVAWKRILAFLSAALIGTTVFHLLNYSLISLTVYLLIYHLICQIGNFMEGFSMSTVLMLHIWKGGAVSLPLLMNEFGLMLIGISMGIIMNLYMPSRIGRIRKIQREIELEMSQILFEMSRAVFQENADENIKQRLDDLEKLIHEALFHSQYTEKNFLFRDMSYYVSYTKMRMDQVQLLKRIYQNLPRLQESYMQTNLVSKFMRITAISMDEYNNASDLLQYLSKLRKQFRKAPLPTSRQEFESRAVLYEIVNELQELLILKQNFSSNLTAYQIETFWQ